MKRVSICLLCLLVFSCKRENSELTEFEEVFKQTGLESMLYKHAILIIPNAGCEGCISSAESFVMNNIDKLDDIQYVFTAIQSHKLLRIRLGQQVYDHDKVYLDGKNDFYNSGYIQLYPVVLYPNNGKIERIIEQNPKNEYALEALQAELMK